MILDIYRCDCSSQTFYSILFSATKCICPLGIL